MLPGNIDPRRPEKQQRYKPPPASNNAAPGEDLTPDYMNILDPQRKSMHSSHSRSDRFKVVKIESAEPFKRGRWECMDFLDQSYNRIFQHNAVARQVTSDVNINLHSSSTFRSELHRALSQAHWGSNVDLHGSMLQLFYRQNNNIVSAEDANRSRSFLQSVSSVCQPSFEQNVQHSTCNSAPHHNHVLMPGMVTSSLVGIKYPLELNFMIDEATRESMSVAPQVSNSSFVSHTTRHPFSFPFKGQMLNQVHCCNVHSSNVIDSHFKRDIQKFQNMSSEQTHFVQQNDIMNTSVAQNSSYPCSQHQQDQLNNETFTHNNNNVSVNHNGRARNGSHVDNGNQQTAVNKMVYQEQVNTCHISNNTDNTSSTMHRYSSEACNTPNNNEFNTDSHRNFNMNTQIYGSVPPVLCHQATNFQDQNGQHQLNTQVPINKNLINNNHIAMSNQHSQAAHTALNANGGNYSNETSASLPNSNVDISSVHVSVNACHEKEQNFTKYTHSPLYSMKTKTHIVKSDCDNAIPPPMPSNVNNNELNNSVNSSTPQYTSVKSFANNNGSSNSLGNQTVSSNGHSNQYFVPTQVRPAGMQNIHYISNVSNQSNSHTNIKLNENNYMTDSQVLIPSYLSSSLVFPIISNQLHVPLCPQILSQHGNLMPKISEQAVNSSVINKTIQSVNSNVMVQHVSNPGLSQSVVHQPQNVSSCVHSFLEEQHSSGSNIGDSSNKSSAQNSIDTKIEALMDLVKKHLKFAVLEDVNVLKQKILMLKERVAQLEYENELLRRCDNPNSYKDNV